MIEKFEMMQVLMLTASLGVAVFTLVILLLVFMMLKKGVEQRPISFISNSNAHPSASAIIAARKMDRMEQIEKVEKPEKPEKPQKPGRSCGHCGAKIKGDPVKGIALEEQSYLVFECASCKKQTLLVQEPVNESSRL